MIYFCCDQNRRVSLADPNVNRAGLNGIDYLEVLDHEVPEPMRQCLLKVHFINPVKIDIGPDNVRIEGGERIRNIVVKKVTPDTGKEPRILTVEVEAPGDFSTYTLRLVQGPQELQPPQGIDPMFTAVDFSFKVECSSDFDCQPSVACSPEPLEEPEINYLAKDYASFRRLMLDRISALMPQWSERHAADVGVTLMELLAYVGDYLSYQQDAVATEAYLGTARRRVSVRRHARLVDYFMHDGCNARVWVQVQVNADTGPLPKGTRLFTRITGQPVILPDDPRILQQAQVGFETMHDVPMLYVAHQDLPFYTWRDQRCCLPKGSTRATLDGHFPNLKAGDVLIFEEIVGPDTGQPGDADPAHRQAVRLTAVNSVYFELTDDSLANLPVPRVPNPIVAKLQVVKNKTFFRGQDFLDAVRAQVGETQTARFKPVLLQHAEHTLVDPLADGTAQLITEIEWSAEDALTFPLCISSRTDAEHGEKYIPKVSVAHGNIVLADHGLTETNPPIPATVPEPTIFRPPAAGGDPCVEIEPVPVPPRYRPLLKNQPLTHAAPYDATASAAAAMSWDIQTAAPVIKLASVLNADKATWLSKRDLLNSAADAPEFVVEIDTDGTAYLRFGDDQLGRRPDPLTAFTATYRVGNGVAGNIGAESLAHIVTGLKAVTLVRNPLPARGNPPTARGGVDPEPLESVRQAAPVAFRRQERAVTEADYAEVTERHPGVQKAVATFRWTGSWHTVFITVDRLGGLEVDEPFKREIAGYVEQYRMAGYDVEVDGPQPVSLEIEMRVCAQPDYFRSDIKAALLELFSNRSLPDGRPGVFHPDNFTFGQPVWLSRLIAAAQAVPGVTSVHVTTFRRQGSSDAALPADGRLAMGRLEIARCDNDPNYPEHGKFSLTVGGGK